jgi:hypothetical protein
MQLPQFPLEAKSVSLQRCLANHRKAVRSVEQPAICPSDRDNRVLASLSGSLWFAPPCFIATLSVTVRHMRLSHTVYCAQHMWTVVCWWWLNTGASVTQTSPSNKSYELWRSNATSSHISISRSQYDLFRRRSAYRIQFHWYTNSTATTRWCLHLTSHTTWLDTQQ